MILILSKKDNEISTEDILQWIHFHKEDCLRLNGSDIILSDIKENLEKCKNVKVIFFRRYVSYKGLLSYKSLNLNPANSHRFLNHIADEFNKFYSFFLTHFQGVQQISSYEDEKMLNKLNVLKIAKALNIIVPETLITNSLVELKKFLLIHQSCIVKPMGECQFYTDENYHYKMLSEKITTDDLLNIPDVFFPSFFQNYVEKKYEIRAFYLNEKIYSMAIFSQSNDKTSIDFRNYDDDEPNRTVPYKLPIDIEAKLIMLMISLELKTGSIDLIKSLDNKYVFLEVNANGQFGMVSYPCNYFLEERIAKYLIKIKNTDEKNQFHTNKRN